VKAFTLGGLSGGLLPASMMEMRLDFATPRKHDAFLGSGGIVVADRSRCLVRFAFEAVRFYAGESCGKCFPAASGRPDCGSGSTPRFASKRWTSASCGS
jgi:NADH-quinone oxidoreductase subunit F